MTVAYQAPPSMEFSRQEYWCGVPLPSPIVMFAAAKLLQSCPTMNDPIDGSPPGSPVPGILQARMLEWVAISFSLVNVRRVLYPLETDRRSSRPREAAAFYAFLKQGHRNRAPE